MSTTKIEYLNYTWNVAPGCTMVSPGCTNCWAQMMAKRLAAMGQENYKGLTKDGHWTGTVHMLPEKLDDPLHLKKPRKIGVNYMGDLFHPNVSFDFIKLVFMTMWQTKRHTYFVLTKRPERAFEFLHEWRPKGVPDEWRHVLIGATIENQEQAKRRVVAMTNIHEAGWRTWVSYEPALSKVYWGPYNFIDFMVCGGESGPRPMHPDWVRSARDWCLKHEIKFFFKQWGSWVPLDHLSWVTDSTTFRTSPIDFKGTWMCKVGKHRAGRVLDGRTWDETPIPSPSPKSEERI